MSAMRLQKYLAACGIGSRRFCETLITSGRVTINGAVAALGAAVNPDADTVAVDGRSVRIESRRVYILLHKPAGVVTTVRDPQGRRTVLDCVAGTRERVFPVGRLDADVEGALLLTNDGELANRLMHPRYGVKKVYHARVAGYFPARAVQALQRGIELYDGTSAPAEVRILRRTDTWTDIKLTIHEGRKREVKRMCAAVGHPVLRLRRLSFAGLSLAGMRRGEWRHLTDVEVRTLREITGMMPVPEPVEAGAVLGTDDRIAPREIRRG
mgnify:CR=1 FL=1